MIFMDGRRLAQARSLTDFAGATDTFFVAAGGQSIYARFQSRDPNRHTFEITLDYFGDQRPADAPPTVGPFQDLERLGLGRNREAFVRLWPIDASRQPPAQSLRIDRPMPELDEQEKAAGEQANQQ